MQVFYIMEQVDSRSHEMPALKLFASKEALIAELQEIHEYIGDEEPLEALASENGASTSRTWTFEAWSGAKPVTFEFGFGQCTVKAGLLDVG